MGNRGANRRHGLAMAAAGLRASAGECGAGDLPGRLEGECVRADTGSQCQNDAGRCGTQECPVCRGAAGIPCGARRAHAAITYGIAVLRQKWGTVANLVVFPNELVSPSPRCPVFCRDCVCRKGQILLHWSNIFGIFFSEGHADF